MAHSIESSSRSTERLLCDIDLSPPSPLSQVTASVSANSSRSSALKRNREAAARSRKKKQAWTESIQESARALGRQNDVLKSNVLELRHQVLMLKEEALLHEHCACDGIRRYVEGEAAGLLQAHRATGGNADEGYSETGSPRQVPTAYPHQEFSIPGRDSRSEDAVQPQEEQPYYSPRSLSDSQLFPDFEIEPKMEDTDDDILLQDHWDPRKLQDRHDSHHHLYTKCAPRRTQEQGVHDKIPKSSLEEFSDLYYSDLLHED